MTPEEREQLRRIPKAELHLHLEGSLRSATLWMLAQRQGHPFGLTDLAACERLYQFSNFAGFIQAIKTASQLLQSPADYAAAVWALARELQTQGVVYAEVFFSVGILLWKQVAVEPYWEAIEGARMEAEAETGVRLRWIFDAVRQFGAEPFEQVVDWAIKLQSSSSVVAIGVGGDERQRQCSEFALGYARAREHGLCTTIHAGESCGPESIWDALRQLKPDRIGHGLHACEDERLMSELAEAEVILDICTISNHKTGVWPTQKTHPAHLYYIRNIKCSLSTDDPGIFGCHLLDEYAWLQDHGGFSPAELARLAADSLPLGIDPPSTVSG